MSSVWTSCSRMVSLPNDDRAAALYALLVGDLLGLLAGVRLVGRRIPPAVGGPIREEAAAEVVGPRLRDRRNGRAADLVVLGLVVGCDDLVLADGQLDRKSTRLNSSH